MQQTPGPSLAGSTNDTLEVLSIVFVHCSSVGANRPESKGSYGVDDAQLLGAQIFQGHMTNLDASKYCFVLITKQLIQTQKCPTLLLNSIYIC